ncbi:hypothetical protein ACFQZE_16545 [Paenibacillus sp. GCM10027627]
MTEQRRRTAKSTRKVDDWRHTLRVLPAWPITIFNYYTPTSRDGQFVGISFHFRTSRNLSTSLY